MACCRISSGESHADRSGTVSRRLMLGIGGGVRAGSISHDRPEGVSLLDPDAMSFAKVANNVVERCRWADCASVVLVMPRHGIGIVNHPVSEGGSTQAVPDIVNRFDLADVDPRGVSVLLDERASRSRWSRISTR